MRTEGAFTDNARTDYDYTVTLPNHCCQLTGRGVLGATGHNWTENTDPPEGATLASNKGSYVAGVCDVAHDNGLRTGIYANKSKFSLFDVSWNAANGAVDVTPPDNGRDKVDIYYMTAGSVTAVNQLVTEMKAQPFGYAFIHLADLDRVGGWDPTPGSTYCNALMEIDDRLGAIFNMIDTTPQFAGRTAVILTADHGGTPAGHNNAGVVENYTIPFYVWGPGVTPGADLYALNPPSRRSDPGTSRPTYSASVQPIRNGEAANVALKLLGLSAVPGSTINSAQDLKWNSSTDPVPSAPVATAATGVTHCSFTANWTSVSGATGYLLDVSTNSSFSSFVNGCDNIIVGNVLSFNVTGVDASTTFYYRVWAYNANGTGPKSGTISATTTANVSAPSAPDATAATAITGTSFTANWNVGCGSTGYRLDVSTSSTFNSYVAGYQNLDVGNVTSWTVSGLSGSTLYYYRVRAYNGFGASGNSGNISITTADINFCLPSVLLGHGDMEDSSTVDYSVCPDWWSYNAGNGAASWAKEKTIIHGGSAAQRAKNINGVAGSLIGIYQTVDANVGDAFTFEGWVYPESNPAYQQVALAARWDGSTVIPDGTASWQISGGSRLSWTHVQGFSGNATANQVTLFLDSREKSGSVSITAYWDDVVAYRAYVPPPPTLSAVSSTSLNIDVNAGCNSTNAAAQFAISIGGGAYTLGTHWLQANGSIGTTPVWQTDVAWGTRTVAGLSTGVPYTFKEQTRYSSAKTQPTSFGSGATLAPQEPAANPPEIGQQPANQTVSVGDTTTFTVVATGSGTLYYQWQKSSPDGPPFNNIANDGHFSGALSSALTISSADANDAGYYHCVVTNAYGSVVSSNATLTVTPGGVPPFITQSPTNQSVAVGGNVSFTVLAGGSEPLSYQWQKNQTSLSNGGHYSGCTTAKLTITGADANDAANYRCVVTNAYGGTNSSPATLTLIVPCNPVSLTNNNFEGGTNANGVASGWVGYQRAPNPTTVWSIQIASSPEGLHYQQIANTSSAGGGGVRQDITGCVVGATYQISGWMRGNSVAYSTCTVKVSPTASTDWSTAVDLVPPQTFTGNYWTNFSGTVVTTGTNMTIWLDGQTGDTGQNKAECFDSVMVTCVGGPTPLQFESVSLTGPNQVGLTLSGPPGVNVTIQSSSNLVNWITLTNLANPTGTVQFTDTSASNILRRFYRATSP